MVRRLILDTGLLIASERGTTRLDELIGPDDDVAIAAITVAELYTGLELATSKQRAARADFVDDILGATPVEPYDARVAQVHGRLLAHVHRSGTKRGAHDLLIAATASATGRTVVTMDKSARFADLPDVDCVTIT